MRVGDLVISENNIGIVRKLDPECASRLTVFICWLQSGLVSWEDPDYLVVLCE